MIEIIRLTTTVATEEDAGRLGNTLVKEGCAACVSWHAITSAYSWKGEHVEANEWRVEAKMSRTGAEETIARLRQLHPYELPEILIDILGATEDYAAWMEAGNTAGGRGE